MRVGISGMGRIGRLALRAAMGAAERQDDDLRRDNRLDVVHLNEIKGGAAACAHLVEFDSVQGRWRAPIGAEDNTAIRIGNRRLSFSEHTKPGDIPWGDLGVDVVLDCTGKFLTPETLTGHLIRGAKRVIVAAPVKQESVLNVVIGVNEQDYDPAKHPIVTAASCTTNCLAPVVKVVHEAIGIRHGKITTIHNPTNTNVVTDASHKDLRRARSEKAAEDVGFYYAANASGRFAGILLSGLLYGFGGIEACLLGSAAMLLACWIVTLRLPTEPELTT